MRWAIIIIIIITVLELFLGRLYRCLTIKYTTELMAVTAGQGVEAEAQAKQIARQEPSSRFGLLAQPAICQRIKDMVRWPLGWVQVRLELIDGTVDNIIIIIINVIVHD